MLRSEDVNESVLEALAFEVLPKLDEATKARISAASLDANSRYLLEFIEEYAFCPYSRGGRRKGITSRHVFFLDTPSPDGVLDLMQEIAADSAQVVAQVIFPLVEVSGDDWRDYAMAVTRAGHRRIGGHDVLACAPLHPELRYTRANDFSLIPLFRRAPDPTIQWVRLDGLAQLYEGRGSDTAYVSPEEVLRLLDAPKKKAKPLFDRIAATNRGMAERLGFEHVESILAELARTAKRRYQDILLEDRNDAERSCPAGVTPSSSLRTLGDAPAHDVVLAGNVRVAEASGDGRLRLIAWRDLQEGRPVAVRAGSLDLVVIRRAEDVRVFFGLCPHRGAHLAGGTVEAGSLVCPSHGWEWDLATGRSADSCGRDLAIFEASVDPHDGYVHVREEEILAWDLRHPEAFGRVEYMGA